MVTGKFLRLLILFLLTTFNVSAQPLNFDRHLVDSLERILPKAANDTNKVNNLMDLSQMYIEKSDHDRSLSYARMADSISQQLRYDRGRVRSLAHIAFVYAATGNRTGIIVSLRYCESKWRGNQGRNKRSPPG